MEKLPFCAERVGLEISSIFNEVAFNFLVQFFSAPLSDQIQAPMRYVIVISPHLQISMKIEGRGPIMIDAFP